MISTIWYGDWQVIRYSVIKLRQSPLVLYSVAKFSNILIEICSVYDFFVTRIVEILRLILESAEVKRGSWLAVIMLQCMLDNVLFIKLTTKTLEELKDATLLDSLMGFFIEIIETL